MIFLVCTERVNLGSRVKPTNGKLSWIFNSWFIRVNERLIKQIQSESKDGRQQDEVAGFIRVELERVATSKGIPDEAIAAYSLEQLRSAVFGVGEAPVALGVGAAELPVLREVDIAMLGMQPLGASYVVPGKALLSVEQRADVDDRRAAQKDWCFSKHLDTLDSVQWALCTCWKAILSQKGDATTVVQEVPFRDIMQGYIQSAPLHVLGQGESGTLQPCPSRTGSFE